MSLSFLRSRPLFLYPCLCSSPPPRPSEESTGGETRLKYNKPRRPCYGRHGSASSSVNIPIWISNILRGPVRVHPCKPATVLQSARGWLGRRGVRGSTLNIFPDRSAAAAAAAPMGVEGRRGVLMQFSPPPGISFRSVPCPVDGGG